ncbi:MAG TPA: hypothetical protein VFX56_07835 [Nitrospira sp.]|nr:hypothetical protein [Nitrospira sp.]
MVTPNSPDASHVTIMKRSRSGRGRQALLASCMALALFSVPNLVWADDSQRHRLINQQRIQDMKGKVADLREQLKYHQQTGGGVPGSTLNLESRVAALEAAVANLASFDPAVVLQAMQSLQNQVTTLDGKIVTLDGKMTVLDGKTLTVETKLGDVEKKMIPDLDKYVSVNTTEMNGVKGPHLVFRGVNVHVQSGANTTADTTSGLGNLIIGYNEANPAQLRTGSHNLVGGTHNGFSAYGGLVFGVNNKSAAGYASVLSGEGNTASGITSAILGGRVKSVSWQNGTSSVGEPRPPSGQ